MILKRKKTDEVSPTGDTANWLRHRAQAEPTESLS